MAQIGDILAKLGSGENLTDDEKKKIRLWGNQSEYDHSYISGIQNGMGDISASVITGNTFYAGKEQFSGLACKFINDGFTVPNNALTAVTLGITRYNDGYSFDGTYATIPITGYYSISMDTTFYDSVSESNRLMASVNSHIYVIARALAGEDMTLTGSTEVYLTRGSTMGMTVLQNSGSDLSILRSSMAIRKIR